MTISLIIPTFNGAAKLKNLLFYLESQSVFPLEIIIVIDGSTDATLYLLKDYISNGTKLPLQIIWQENGGRGSARALGARKAKGEILLFTDDDVSPPVRWIELHQYHFQDDQVSCGPVLPTPCAYQNSEFFRYFIYLTQKWAPSEQSDQDIEVSEFSAVNFCISSQLYYELGGFDSSLRDAEDRDLSRRIASKQIPIVFRPKCSTYASAYRNFYEYTNRRRQYDQGNSRLKSLNPRSCFLHNIKTAIFTPHLNSLLLDLIPVLRILPVNLRYKLYNFILF